MSIIEQITGGTLMTLSAMAHRENFDVITSKINENLFTSDKCPDIVKVFADDSKNYLQNDFSMFLFDAGVYNISFKLLKDCEPIADLVNDDYGTYFQKGFWKTSDGFSVQQSLYSGYRISWTKILDLLGVGSYSIETIYSLGESNVATLCSCSFLLQTYSDQLADKTIRFRTIQNGHILDSFDYTGMNLEQSWRMDGFFGYPQEKIEVDNYLNKNRNLTQIQDQIFNEYTLQTDFINDCQKNIFSDILLSNEIYVDDYNLKNAYVLKNISVIPTQSDSNYFVESTETFKEITFEDRKRKKVKRNVK